MLLVPCLEQEHVLFWQQGAVFGKLTYFDFSISWLPSGRKTFCTTLCQKIKTI